MKTNKEENIKNFTRGGQIILHNLRMYTQVVDKVTWIIAFIFLIIVALWFVLFITGYERYVFGEYLWSLVSPLLNPTAKTDFIQQNGVKTLVNYSDIHSSLFVKEMVRQTCLKLIQGMLVALVSSSIGFVIISRRLRKHGEKQTINNLLKGDKILSPKEANLLIKKMKINSDLKLADLPLIKDSETAHIFFHGSTGSGKSSAIKELLDQIRKRGERAIIYDKSCNYLEEFFDARYDYLLNPLDERGMSWDLWQECRDSADFDSLAAAQIPMPLSAQDPFWVNAARTIFSAAAYKMRNDKNKSISKLLKFLLASELNTLQDYLKGTVAESLVSEKIEKTAISIKSVLATYLKSLNYIKDDGNVFSIRQWIQDEKNKNWLFITSLGNKHETLKPLITTWMDIAVNTVLSLTPNEERRIWLILDELTSLNQLPYLSSMLSEGRKFGGCIIISVQNYAQLSKVYGQEGAREISSLLNTRVMFRQPDPDIAHWSASNLGEAIYDEVREGISYGANTMRDGISINRVEVKKALVSYSEIMSLAKYNAYVRLLGDIPITNISFPYKKRHCRNIGMVERKLEKDPEREIEKWLKDGTIFYDTHSEDMVAAASKHTIDIDQSLDM